MEIAMKTSHVVGLLVAVVLASGSPGAAAPALGDKASRWEYAELHVQRAVAAIRIVPPGGAAPAPVPAPAAPATTVRWATADEEVQADGWEQLAEKLKAPAPKKEGTPTVHKLRVFNRLGADG